MKIRIVPQDDRSDIRQCEDCKEKGKNGMFLTLGFFNGFVCNDCANRLAFLIRQEGIWYEPSNQPDTTAGTTASGVEFGDIRLAQPAGVWTEHGVYYEPENQSNGTIQTFPTEIDSPNAFGDTPQSRQDAPRTIFGNESTQEIAFVVNWLLNAVVTLQAQRAKEMSWNILMAEKRRELFL